MKITKIGVSRTKNVTGITRLLIRSVAHPRREAAIEARPTIRTATNMLLWNFCRFPGEAKNTSFWR